MPWRFGAWWPQDPEPAPHLGYARVTGRGYGGFSAGRYRGKFTGFTCSGGRPPGQLGYIGGTCRITIEDWQFAAADIRVGQPIAIRWDSGDDDDAIAADAARWPKGPPCVFAGFVVSYDTRFLSGGSGAGDGDPVHSITTIVADDMLGSHAFNTPWLVFDEADLQGSAWPWLQRTTGIRNRAEGVLLGSPADIALADDDLGDWGDLSAGEAIRKVTETTATEIFLRHGERIGVRPGQGPPAEDGSYSNVAGESFSSRNRGFYIRSPQLVMRKVGHFSDPAVSPTTFDAPQSRVTDDDASTLTSDNYDAGERPIPRRFRAAGRTAEFSVNYPPIMDRVTLFSRDYTANPDGSAATGHKAESANIVGTFEQNWMERSQLMTEDTAAFNTQLDRNALAFRNANSNYFKTYTMILRALTDDELNTWAGIGIGDEVVIHELDLDHATTTGSICQVRHFRWDASYYSGTTLTLQVVPHPTNIPDGSLLPTPTPPVTALWAGHITWGSGNGAHSGYDAPGGSDEFGLLDDRTVTIGSVDVTFDGIIRRRDGKIRVVVGTTAEMNALEGLYLRMELASGDIWVQIPTVTGNVADSIRVIPDADRPANGETIAVSLYDELPSGAALTPEAPAEPPAPDPDRLWLATITWGSSAGTSGWSQLSPTFGHITDDDFTTAGVTVDFDEIVVTSTGRVRFTVGSAAEFDALEGKYLRIEWGTGTDQEAVVVVPAVSGTSYTSAEDTILPANIPPDLTRLAVSVWTHDPSAEDRTAGLPTPPRTVPDLAGLAEPAARAAITAAGLTVGAVTDVNVSVAAENDLVQTQTPDAGAMRAHGDAVSFTLGNYVAAQVAVPDVSGLLQAAARTAIENAGLVVNFIDEDQTSGTDDEVISQTPAAGTMVDSGSTVTVTVRNLVAAPPEPQKLRDMVLTWGSHSANVPRHGFSLSPPDDEAYGALTNRTITIGSTVVEISRLAELGNPGQDPPDPNDGRVRIDVGNHTQAEALAGHWLRFEPTGTPADDIIFQVPQPEGTDSHLLTAANTFPSDDAPPDGTQIAVSVWDLQPVGQPATPNLPIAAVTIPANIVGMTQAAATTALQDLGLTVTVATMETTDQTQIGDVISTAPAAGGTIVAGGTVTITVGIAVAQVAVPDVAGDTVAEAQQALQDAGLVAAAEFGTDVDTLVPGDDNLVHSTSPAIGSMVDPGTVITLTLWNYHGVTVPDIVGDPIGTVETDIADLGLVLVQSFTNTTDTANTDDTVATQAPAAGTIVAPGSTVTVTVWNRQAVIPNLNGQPRDLAQSQLENLGFVVAFATGPETSNADLEDDVQSMSPGPGMQEDVGSTVTLTIWDYQAPVPTVTPLWEGVLVWGDSPGSDPRQGFSSGSFDSSGDYGALTNNGATISGAVVNFSAIRRLGDEDQPGTIRIDVSTNDAGNALQGKYLRLELEGAMLDGVIFPIQDEIGTSATSAVIIDDAELDSIGFGTQIAVNIWDDDPAGQPRQNTALPRKLPTGALAAAAVQVGREGSWYGWWTGEGLANPTPALAYGVVVPSTGHAPWQFNHGTPSELVEIVRTGLNSNRRARLWVAEAADATAITGLWVRFDLPGVTAPAIGTLPTAGGNPAVRFNLRNPDNEVQVLAAGDDRPDEGEVFMVSLWPTQAAAQAG